MPGLLDGLVKKGDRVLCVVPIDESAPKGRLILPQQQVIRECLDKGVVVTVCGLEDVRRETEDESRRPDLVITDSQAFGAVNLTISKSHSQKILLTSFSILFARQKGDLDEYVKGLRAIKTLADGDMVLIAEGCTHHRQCNDIGSVKIPKALEKLSGKKLKFAFASGNGFAETFASLRSGKDSASPLRLVVHCGACMQTRREVLRRIALAKEAAVPIVNYGMVLAMANGIDVADVLPASGPVPASSV